MKRLLVLTLTAAFVLSTSVAFAKEVTMQGQFETVWQWSDNANFFDTDGDQASEDDFGAKQRIRQYFNYVDSENLSGTIAFQMDTDWGDPADGGQLGTDSSANANTIRLKRAHIDFNWPGTSLHVRSGLQGLTFPGAVAGSPIWDDDVAGVVASYGINDHISVVAGWARLYDRNIGTDGTGDSENDEIDAFTVIMPITMDGWSLTPYAIYAAKGRDAEGYDGTTDSGVSGSNTLAGLEGIKTSGYSDDSDVWWAGGAFTMNMFDPLNISADLIYGAVDSSSNGTSGDAEDREGWFFTAKAAYTMDFATPGLFVMYSSGEDDDPNNGSEAFPILSSCYGATSFGFDGSAMWKASDNLLTGNDFPTVMLAGAELADMSFIEGLSHTVRVVYGVGTSDSDLTKNHEGTLNANRGINGVLLTDEDSFVELNLDSSYAIYEALTAYVEMGYIDLDLDDASHPSVNVDNMESAWKLAVGLKYNY